MVAMHTTDVNELLHAYLDRGAYGGDSSARQNDLYHTCHHSGT